MPTQTLDRPKKKKLNLEPIAREEADEARPLNLEPIDPDELDRPRKLNLEPINPDDFEAEQAFDKKKLNLVPLEGAPQAPPAQEEDWDDWFSRQATDASEAALTFLDSIRATFGFEPKPGDANANMSRVEQPLPPPIEPGDVMADKITAEGGVADYLIPDWIEYPLRKGADFFNSPRTQRDLEAGMDSAAVFTFGLAKNSVEVVNWAADGLGDLFDEKGQDYVKPSDRAILPGIIDESWKELQDDLAAKEENMAQWYARDSIQGPDRTVVDALIEALPQLPGMIAVYGFAGAKLGAAKGFAAVEALLAADEGPEATALSAAKGYALGTFFEWTNVLSRPLRMVPLAASGGGLAALEGGSDADIAAQSILFPVLALPMKSGPISARYLREHGIGPDMRDAGAHIRDMLSNTVKAVQGERDLAREAFIKVRGKNALERHTQHQKYIEALDKAREARPGDTPESVAEREAEVTRQYEEHIENTAVVHRGAELPHRQALDHAERRLHRAKHPFRATWAEAPYMRALHMQERTVLVVHKNGYKMIETVNQQAAAREQDGLKHAQELRAKAEATSNLKRKKELEAMAAHVQDETRRVTYDMRTKVEDTVEQQIEIAEARAERARNDLIEAIERRSAIEGRRARWLQADRNLTDSYSYGTRVILRGNRRARELLRMGDDLVANTRDRLRRAGVTEENEATKDIYQKAMADADILRQHYRDAASLELLDAATRADGRVSVAFARMAAANETPAEARLRIRNQRLMEAEQRKRPSRPKKFRKNQKPTKPDDAKKPEEPGGDPPPEPDTLPKDPDYEVGYKLIMQSALRDPKLSHLLNDIDRILSKIENPADVLPAINRVAEKHGYDPPSRRGRQTAQRRKEAAAKLGMTEEEFINSPYGRAFNDAQLEAVISILERGWQRVTRAYEVWMRTGSETARARYEHELYRFMMIWERLRGAAAEAGRGLRMFREVKQRFSASASTLSDRQIDMIMNAENPSSGMKILKAVLSGNWWDALIEYYIMGLLSSAQTSFVNIYSAVAMLAKNLIRAPVAATIGVTRWALYNFIGKYLLKPFKMAYRAYVKGFGSQKAKDRVAQIERDEAMPSVNPRNFISNDRVRFGEWGARVKGLFEALLPAFGQFMKTLFGGRRYLDTGIWNERKGAIPWWLGGPIIRFPGRILSAIDDFFKVIMYQSAIRAHAFREAAMSSANVDVMKHWGEVRKRYRELVKHPTPAIKAAAKAEALEGTFQQAVDPSMSWVPGLTERNPVFRVLIPFSRTLLNGVETVLSGTPAALIFKRARTRFLQGGAARDEVIAEMLMGMGLTYLVYSWAMEGGVERGYTKDEGERTIAGVRGTPPLSLRVPGTDRFVSVNRVDPVGAYVALAAGYAEYQKRATIEGDEEAAEKAFFMFFSSTMAMLSDRAGLRGLMEFMDAFQGGTYGKSAKSWDAWANNLAATLTMPQGAAVWARTQDPVLRYAQTYLEKLMARTPGEREKLFPVRNAWGDPIIAYDSYGSGPVGELMDLTQPLYWGRRSQDPATQALVLMHEAYRWAPGSLDRNVAGRRLTDQEYDYYAQRAGRRSYEGVSQIVASREWRDAMVLDKEARDLKAQIKARKTAGHRKMDAAEYKAAEALLKEKSDRLRVARYNLLQTFKKSFTAARRGARLDLMGTADGKVKGKHPKIWKRPRLHDDLAKDGMWPEWARGWFEADEGSEWDADENIKANNEADPDSLLGTMSEIEARERALNARALEEAKKRRRGTYPARP